MTKKRNKTLTSLFIAAIGFSCAGAGYAVYSQVDNNTPQDIAVEQETNQQMQVLYDAIADGRSRSDIRELVRDLEHLDTGHLQYLDECRTEFLGDNNTQKTSLEMAENIADCTMSKEDAADRKRLWTGALAVFVAISIFVGDITMARAMMRMSDRREREKAKNKKPPQKPAAPKS